MLKDPVIKQRDAIFQPITPPDREIRIPMSYEEFLALSGEHQHAEWEDGETIIFMPATPEHQDMVSFLLTLLRLFVDFFKLGKVLTAPVEMKTSSTSNAREPDILFIAGKNLERLNDKRLSGPADLVIEVISPESVRRDRNRKFREYQEAGVREYWVIDGRSNAQRADFWILDQSGQYRNALVDEDGIYRSTVIKGFWLDEAWLWQSPLPDSFTTFAAIAGFPPEMLDMLRKIAERGPMEE